MPKAGALAPLSGTAAHLDPERPPPPLPPAPGASRGAAASRGAVGDDAAAVARVQELLVEEQQRLRVEYALRKLRKEKKLRAAARDPARAAADTRHAHRGGGAGGGGGDGAGGGHSCECGGGWASHATHGRRAGGQHPHPEHPEHPQQQQQQQQAVQQFLQQQQPHPPPHPAAWIISGADASQSGRPRSGRRGGGGGLAPTEEGATGEGTFNAQALSHSTPACHLSLPALTTHTHTHSISLATGLC